MMHENATDDQYVEQVKSAKRSKQLHNCVEKKLSELLLHLYPDARPVAEVVGMPGGRNDLIQFFPNGCRVVFELFATLTQVPQDLRLLEQSTADVKIAVLLDKKVDSKLAKEYFHKKPDSFPFLWLEDVLRPERKSQCLKLLRELIESKRSSRTGVTVELSEKRLPYYKSLSDLLRKGTQPLDLARSYEEFAECWRRLREKKDEFVFAFGGDVAIAAYLDKVHKKSVDIHHVYHRIFHSDRPATAEERDNLSGQSRELHEWFSDKLKNLPSRFKPFLSIK